MARSFLVAQIILVVLPFQEATFVLLGVPVGAGVENVVVGMVRIVVGSVLRRG